MATENTIVEPPEASMPRRRRLRAIGIGMAALAFLSISSLAAWIEGNLHGYSDATLLGLLRLNSFSSLGLAVASALGFAESLGGRKSPRVGKPLVRVACIALVVIGLLSCLFAESLGVLALGLSCQH
jgi:MFS family permease